MEDNNHNHITLTQIHESSLTHSERNQINDALLREFRVSLPPIDPLFEKLFFLLKRADVILAIGGLMEVKPVIFDKEEFVVYGFVDVVANEKGRGYGKQVLKAMSDYLRAHDKTGLGFCMLKNKPFYEKCGFQIETASTHRFVYIKGEEKEREEKE